MWTPSVKKDGKVGFLTYLCSDANRKAPVPAFFARACPHVVPGQFSAAA